MSVAPMSAFPGYDVESSEASENGTVYAAANGQLVQDEGCVEPVFYTDGGLVRTLNYAVTDVHKVLTSAARVCNSGCRIVLDSAECESYILDKETNEKIALRQKDDVYVFHLHVMAPASPSFTRQAFVP